MKFNSNPFCSDFVNVPHVVKEVWGRESRRTKPKWWAWCQSPQMAKRNYGRVFWWNFSCCFKLLFESNSLTILLCGFCGAVRDDERTHLISIHILKTELGSFSEMFKFVLLEWMTSCVFFNQSFEPSLNSLILLHFFWLPACYANENEKKTETIKSSFGMSSKRFKSIFIIHLVWVFFPPVHSSLLL